MAAADDLVGLDLQAAHTAAGPAPWIQLLTAAWCAAGLLFLVVPSLVVIVVHRRRMRGADSPDGALDAALGPTWSRRYWIGFWIFLVGLLLLIVALTV